MDIGKWYTDLSDKEEVVSASSEAKINALDTLKEKREVLNIDSKKNLEVGLWIICKIIFKHEHRCEDHGLLWKAIWIYS